MSRKRNNRDIVRSTWDRYRAKWRPRSSPYASAVTRFIAALLCRHRLLRCAQPDIRVLRRVLRPRSMWQVHQSLAVSVFTSLSRTVLPSPLARAQRVMVTAPRAERMGHAEPEPARIRFAHQGVVARRLRHSTRRSLLQITERTTQRKAIEELTHGQRYVVGGAPAAVTYALRRGPRGSVPFGSQVPSSSPLMTHERTLWREGPSSASVCASPATAAINVDRLTQEVMRAIDQRIVAHRERMGRG